MASPQQTRGVGATNLPQARGQQVFSGVAAAPTGAVLKPRMSDATEGLLRGLGMLAQTTSAELAKEEDNLRRQGRAHAKAGGDRAAADAKPKSFLTGYLEGLGEAAAINDRSDLIQAYSTDFNKDDGDIEEFLGTFYQQRMKEGGITPEFREAYDAQFAKAADEVRAMHGEAVASNIIDTNRAAAQKRLDQAVEESMDVTSVTGAPLGAALIERWQKIAVDQRIPRKERNEMLYLSLLKYSQEGNPEVWEAARVDRVDPETGQKVDALYSIPEFKQRIDQAEAAARNIRQNRQERDERRAEKELKERQDVAMRDVLDRYYEGDTDGAMGVLKSLRGDRKLFPNASDLINLEKLVVSHGEDLRAPEWEEEEAEMMLEIHSGGVSERDILNADLGRLNKRRLLSYHRQVMADRRREAKDAAADRRREEDVLRSKLVQADLQFIEDSLPRLDSLTDVLGVEADQARMDVAEVKRRFTSIAFENPNLDYRQRREIAQRLIEEVQERRAMRQGNPSTALDRVPFKSYGELVRALDESRITPADFLIYKSRLDNYYDGTTNGNGK